MAATFASTSREFTGLRLSLGLRSLLLAEVPWHRPWATATAGPLFTGGRLTGRLRQAKAACEEAKLQFQDTALDAFREVSDALISHRRFDEERVEQAEAVDAGREAVAVSTQRYREGKASYYEVLEAQQQLFPAENTLSHIEVERRLAIVQLYKALGGGWSLKDPEWFGTSVKISSKH